MSIHSSQTVEGDPIEKPEEEVVSYQDRREQVAQDKGPRWFHEYVNSSSAANTMPMPLRVMQNVKNRRYTLNHNTTFIRFRMPRTDNLGSGVEAPPGSRPEASSLPESRSWTARIGVQDLLVQGLEWPSSAAG